MKKIMFFLVHPSKFHLFRSTINHLKSKGYDIEIVITGRDILEELIFDEGWPYKKIFPKGRKIPFFHIYASAGINFIRTIFKLFIITMDKKFDLFITDDLLTFVGRIKKTPSIFATDDDLRAVPESWLLAASANHILSPSICDMRKYEYKKIGYLGFKSLAHLHPNRFTPDRFKLVSFLQNNESFFFIRLVSATSTHDVGKTGITNNILEGLINILEKNGRIVINSERKLPHKFEKYTISFKKADIAHYISFARIFISDSTTMCAEAAVLGTPSIEIDDWYADFRQYEEFHGKYGLIYGFKPDDTKKIFNKINEWLNASYDLQKEFHKRRQKMLTDKIDVTSLFIWLIENYPESIYKLNEDPNFQLEFK